MGYNFVLSIDCYYKHCGECTWKDRKKETYFCSHPLLSHENLEEDNGGNTGICRSDECKKLFNHQLSTAGMIRG